MQALPQNSGSLSAPNQNEVVSPNAQHNMEQQQRDFDGHGDEDVMAQLQGLNGAGPEDGGLMGEEYYADMR